MTAQGGSDCMSFMLLHICSTRTKSVFLKRRTLGEKCCSIRNEKLRRSSRRGFLKSAQCTPHIKLLSVRKRGSERKEREKALSRLRSRHERLSRPQPGALTLRISQENSIFSPSRKRRMGSLFSSPRTSCLDPFLIDHFPLLTSQGSVRRGL